MGGLVLKLGSNEKILVNGALLQNGPRKSVIKVVSKDAKILRFNEIILEKDAVTPVGRLCFDLQIAVAMGVDDSSQKVLLQNLQKLRDVFQKTRGEEVVNALEQFVSSQNYYQALKVARTLREIEKEILRVGQ